MEYLNRIELTGHVGGRLKMNRYVDGDNVEHVSYEVRASKVEEVKDEQD